MVSPSLFDETAIAVGLTGQHLHEATTDAGYGTYKTLASVWLEAAVRSSSITTFRGWFPFSIFLPVKSPAILTAALLILFCPD